MTNVDTSVAWDRHAATYARLFAPLTSYFAHAMLRLSEARLPASARILDVACGTGALALAAAQHLHERSQHGSPRGTVVATDYAAAMVQWTERAARELGLGEVLHAEVQDGQSLTYADQSFDAVFSCFGIFLFPDRTAGWREAARVLRSGGLFATAVWRGPEHNAMLRTQMKPLMETLPDRIKQAAPARSWLEIATPDALIAEVTRETDLVDARAHVLGASIVLPDAATAWQAMLENPVLGTPLRACDAAELAVVESAVVRALHDAAGGADRPIVLDSSCHVLIARKR